MPIYDKTALFDTLKELGVIAQEDLDKYMEQSNSTGTELHTLLVEAEVISDENMGKVIADLLHVPFVKLTQQAIRSNVLNVIPQIVAKKQQAISFELNETGLKVAMVDPSNDEFKAQLQKKTGTAVEVFLATERDIAETLNLYKKGLQETFDSIIKANIDEKGEPIKKDVSVSKIVDTLIQYAYQNKASDIHIEPEQDNSVVRFRIDGVLHDVLDISRALHEQIVTRIKVLSRLRTDEHMSAQDGKMQMQLDEENLDIRVSLVPVVDGEKCVMRLLSSRSRQFNLQDLGFRGEDLNKVQEAYKQPHGMILCTGPTGSGKTTTIYGVLKQINSRNINIATIEDPVEYDVDGVNQIQVNPKTNLTFADGLRAILRQDPDVIFVGEIRDKETADIATNSAMTGHLVLSTLHTNDAATALPRLLDMDVEPYLVASTVNVIIAQRLVRKICEKCKVSQTLQIKELEDKISKTDIKKHFGTNKEVTLYKGKGCDICNNSGYSGRIGVFEVLVVSTDIREMIVNKADDEDIHKQAVKEGMTTMYEDGLSKVTQGLTTLEEIMRVT